MAIIDGKFMRWSIAVVGLLLLAGCVSEEPTQESGETSLEPNSSPTTPPNSPPSPSSSPAPSTPPSEPAEDCEITVLKQGDRYYASCTTTHALKPGATPEITLSTVNGKIEASTGNENGASVFRWARAGSEDAARSAVESMAVTVTNAVSVEVKSTSWSNRGANIVVEMTSQAISGMDLGTTNGHIEVDGFSGGAWNLDSTNGHIGVANAAADLTAETTNGRIDARGKFGELRLATSNGAIEARATPSKSAAWELDTMNGAITLRVAESSGVGYDIEADTMNGKVSFETTEMQPVGQQSATSGHHQTTGYDARSMKVTASLDTMNASVNVIGTGSASTN
jgi:hypothetical protein